MIAYIGGSHVGALGLLISEAFSGVLSCVAYSKEVKDTAINLNIKNFKSIKDNGFINRLMGADLLLSVGGREIVPKEILEMRPCINIHPGFFKYKGADPISRILQNKPPYKIDVTAHYMTRKIDDGEVIYSKDIIIEGVNSVSEVYNALYPVYINVIFKILKKSTRW